MSAPAAAATANITRNTITSATITSAIATVAAMSIATAAIFPDLVDTLSFAGALAAADATAAHTLQSLIFQGAHREAWTAAHKPL